MITVTDETVTEKFDSLLAKYKDFIVVYKELIPIYQQSGAGAPLILQQMHQAQYGRTATADWIKRLVTLYGFLTKAPIHDGLYLLDDTAVQFFYVCRVSGLLEK